MYEDFENLQNNNYYDEKILKDLYAGLTYQEIAIEHYFGFINKVKYRIRKMRECMGFKNRRQLVFYAYIAGII